MDCLNVEAYKLDSEVHGDHTIHRMNYVERWTRIRQIGRGGFGKVFLEKDLVGRLRAVKELSKEFSATRRQDYLRELFTMAQFSREQAYFPYFRGWYEDSQRVYIAMEYFPCGDLSSCVQGQLPEIEIRQIVFQIVEALVVIHNQGITHRDLKPENIFVCCKGPEWLVKVGDFGISKRIQDGDTSLHTQFLGRYVAPEVLGLVDIDDEFVASYTNAVDVWSLGCLLYWLLEGSPPFLDNKDLARHCKAKMRLPKRFSRMDLSENGLVFLQDCMAVSSKERLSSSEALVSPWLRTAFDMTGRASYSIACSIATKRSNPIPDQRLAYHDETQHVLPLEYPMYLQQMLPAIAKMSVGPILNDHSKQRALQVLENNKTSVQSGHALSLAIKEDDLDLVQLILNSGDCKIRLNARSLDLGTKSHSKTPLEYVMTKNLWQMASLLVEAGANIETRDRYRHTPLMIAAQHGSDKCLTLLLDAGAATEVRSAKSGLTAIALATRHNRAECLQILIERGASINTTDTTGITPVMSAAAAGFENCLCPLVQAGANLELMTHNRGFTALALASSRGHSQCVRILIQGGAVVNQRTKDGSPSLIYAAASGKKSCLAFLLDNGADIEAKKGNALGETALTRAAKFGDLSMVKFLLERGANFWASSGNGITPLKAAVQSGNSTEVIGLFIGKEANINAQSER